MWFRKNRSVLLERDPFGGPKNRGPLDWALGLMREARSLLKAYECRGLDSGWLFKLFILRCNEQLRLLSATPDVVADSHRRHLELVSAMEDQDPVKADCHKAFDECIGRWVEEARSQGWLDTDLAAMTMWAVPVVLAAE